MAQPAPPPPPELRRDRSVEPPKPTPRASCRFGPFVVVWLDLWRNRYGLDLEVTVRRRIYSLAVGFGEGVRARRGWS